MTDMNHKKHKKYISDYHQSKFLKNLLSHHHNQIKKYKYNKYGVLNQIILRKKSYDRLMTDGYVHMWINANYYNHSLYDDNNEVIDDNYHDSLYLKLLQKFEWGKNYDGNLDNLNLHSCIFITPDDKKYQFDWIAVVRIGEMDIFMNETGDQTRIRFDLVRIIQK